MHVIKFILIVFLFVFNACNRDNAPLSWNKVFQEHNVTGAFYLKNLSSQETLVYNWERCHEEFFPASTFKILNSLIALQVSSVKSIDDTIKWDGVARAYKPWNQDQTMRTAFPISCVWFYQELARRTGEEQMQKWITACDYGNQKIENEIDRFWLDGNLKISAKEQVDFLEKLVTDKLPFDKQIQKTVKELMMTNVAPAFTIYSKTGWSHNIGWNVGFVETKTDLWIFAMNINMYDLNRAKLRKLLTYDILREQRIIE